MTRRAPPRRRLTVDADAVREVDRQLRALQRFHLQALRKVLGQDLQRPRKRRSREREEGRLDRLNEPLQRSARCSARSIRYQRSGLSSPSR